MFYEEGFELEYTTIYIIIPIFHRILYQQKKRIIILNIRAHPYLHIHWLVQYLHIYRVAPYSTFCLLYTVMNAMWRKQTANREIVWIFLGRSQSKKKKN